MKYIFSLVLLLSLAILTGCFSTSATIENVEQLTHFDPYSFPMKFYVEKIISGSKKETFYSNANKKGRIVEIPVFHKNEEERWRTALYKYWPHLFSREPDNALKVSFVLDFYSQLQKEKGGWETVSAMFLSTFTFGIIPAVWHEKYRVLIRVKVNESLTSSKQIFIKTRSRGNNGIFGFLRTCFLVPEIENPLFSTINFSFDSANLYKCRVKEEKLKTFLQLFVAELHRLPADQIQKLYLSTKTTDTLLLE